MVYVYGADSAPVTSVWPSGSEPSVGVEPQEAGVGGGSYARDKDIEVREGQIMRTLKPS